MWVLGPLHRMCHPLPLLWGFQTVILCLIQALTDSNTPVLPSKLRQPLQNAPGMTTFCTRCPVRPARTKAWNRSGASLWTLFTWNLEFFFLSRSVPVAPEPRVLQVLVMRHHHSPPHADGREIRQRSRSQSSHNLYRNNGVLLELETSCSRKWEKSQRWHNPRRHLCSFTNHT